MRKFLKELAETATGCAENPSGIGEFYDNRGNELTREQAQDALGNGESVEVPNAGSGSYEAVFKALGFEETKVIEWSSSAGDWTFAVRDEETWYVAFQNNRYPHHGFSYSRDTFPFESFEDACDFACQQ